MTERPDLAELESADETGVDQSTPVLDPEIVSRPLAEATMGELQTAMLASLQASSYSGPLPRGSEYELYESVYAGSANRILIMAEKEQDARIVSDDKRLDERIRRTKFAQRSALVVAILALALCAYAIRQGQSLEAVGLFITATAAFVATFLGGRIVNAIWRDEE